MAFIQEIGVRQEERADCGCGDKAVMTLTISCKIQDSLCAVCARELITTVLGFLPLKPAEPAKGEAH